MNFWQESSSGLRRGSQSQEEQARNSTHIKGTTGASYCFLQLRLTTARFGFPVMRRGRTPACCSNPTSTATPKQRKAQHAGCLHQSGAGAKVLNLSARERQPVRQQDVYKRTRRTGRAPTHTHNPGAKLQASRTIFQKASRKIGRELLDLRLLRGRDGARGFCSCLEETCQRPPREETERLQRGDRRRHSVQEVKGGALWCLRHFLSLRVGSEVLSRFSIRKQMSKKTQTDF